MDRDLLAHLPVFLGVARHGSFAAAANELGMSASAVSHAVRTVEERLGAPLFTRTTRSVALTEVGRRLNESIGAAFNEVQEAIEQIRSERGQVTGLLRLNVPQIALPLAITPVLAELTSRHPQLTVEVSVQAASTDIVAAGFDAGVRLGGMIDGDMVVVRLTPPFKAIMVASPEYLQRHEQITTVRDLANHNCIGYRLPTAGSLYAWEMLDHGQDVAVKVSGTALVNEPASAKDLALAGIGIAYIFEPFVRQELADGRLQWLLPESAIEEPGLFLYFPTRASQAPKLRAFIDAAKDVLRVER
ncbi:MAG TPA: LysR family transcriptional regulator [Steroidobacter sp.]|uniref:LysR family transcriptional regulator n=1 Tax=Steroidobacter sp. TaxID=1978227 RepID=UPI002EDA74FA